jgi:hypothetical protein
MNIPIDQVFEALFAMRHDSGYSYEYSARAEVLADRVLAQLSDAERKQLETRTWTALDAIPRSEYAD